MLKKELSELLQEITEVLDVLYEIGKEPILMSSPILQLYISWLEKIELNLLNQWKILKDHGNEEYKEWVFVWTQEEKRNSSGIYGLWKQLSIDLLNWAKQTPFYFKSYLWESFILHLFTDVYTHQHQFQMRVPIHPKLWEMTCLLFEKIYYLHPQLILKRFLNMIDKNKLSNFQVLTLEEIDFEVIPQTFHEVLKKLWTPVILDDDWELFFENVTSFWKTNSGGKYNQFAAFKLVAKEDTISMIELPFKQTISFEQLYGIDIIQKILIQNIEHLLEEKTAHHVLLWGFRGTGKSSSVIALWNHFVNQNLKLIEIQQEQLIYLPQLFNILKDLPEKFILFCDDISFDQNDESYKPLKSVLEGSILNTGSNTILIATSNRRNIIDHSHLSYEIPHEQQLIDEKRALDDRFGLKLFFDVPQFEQLNKLLFFYANQTKLKYDPENLKTQFHRFCLENHHDLPSGRTVKQFIELWSIL